MDAELYGVVRRKIMGFVVSRAIFVAVKLGVVDLIQSQPRTLEELAIYTGSDADAIGRLLRVLESERLCSRDEMGRCGLTASGMLLSGITPGSLRHLVLLLGEEEFSAWEEVEYSFRTGRPGFDRRFGVSFFEWLAARPAALDDFHSGEAGLAELRAAPLLEWHWRDVHTVVDIGGGNGAMIAMLLTRRSNMRGIVMDLPALESAATHTFISADVAQRAVFVKGDFFNEVPPGADAYVLAEILHDWDDAHAAMILLSCRRAMGPESRLLIVEQVLRDDGRPDSVKLLDLHMLVLLGGKERTADQWSALLDRGGFSLTDVILGPRSSLLVALPRQSC